MLKRVVWLMLAAPAAVCLITFSVINRYKAVLVLNPFTNTREVADSLAQLNPTGEAAQQAAVEAAGAGFGLAPGVGVFLPLSFVCFSFLILGLLAGGAASWMTQSKWRKQARQRTLDAHRWRAEAERLTRERDSAVAASRQAGPAQLPAPSMLRSGLARSATPALSART